MSPTITSGGIDFHTHPVLVREMVERHPELERAAREVFYIGNVFQPLETFFLELDVAGLERAVLLPIDCTTTRGMPIYTNEQIAELCALSDRFVGFASVDPHDPNHVRELERAVGDLGLRGLKLAPGLQGFRPDDRALYPLYAKAQELDIPILFHAGMTWEPSVRVGSGHPLAFEEVARDFPGLQIVLAHLAWPWVLEAVALALKYPNLYLDTSALFFDNPRDFLAFAMGQQVPLTVWERSLRHQLVFGSNYPRVEIKNMAAAVRSLGLSPGCLELVFRRNAAGLLHLE
ncbi:MAG: amidohydrolase family protein [Anaerolineae bacterium]